MAAVFGAERPLLGVVAVEAERLLITSKQRAGLRGRVWRVTALGAAVLFDRLVFESRGPRRSSDGLVAALAQGSWLLLEDPSVGGAVGGVADLATLLAHRSVHADRIFGGDLMA